MERKYWAKRGRKQVGPFATREEALDEFNFTYPVKGQPWTVEAKKNDVMSGYGEYGPYFDIQWSKAYL